MEDKTCASPYTVKHHLQALAASDGANEGGLSDNLLTGTGRRTEDIQQQVVQQRHIQVVYDVVYKGVYYDAYTSVTASTPAYITTDI